MNPLEQLGIKKKEKPNFKRTLFYFMKEFKFNPLDEEYIIDGKKIIKKGMSIPLFNTLMEEMEEYYKKKKQQYERSKRK